jgi:hypothetical protein
MLQVPPPPFLCTEMHWKGRSRILRWIKLILNLAPQFEIVASDKTRQLQEKNETLTIASVHSVKRDTLASHKKNEQTSFCPWNGSYETDT